MILVDGYWDGMLSRTTNILGGGGCKASERLCDGRWEKSSCKRVQAGARAHDECTMDVRRTRVRQCVEGM